jgi:hypothetical protein
MIDLNTRNALLASNKLLSIQLETIAKRLEAREVAQLSAVSKLMKVVHAYQQVWGFQKSR